MANSTLAKGRSGSESGRASQGAGETFFGRGGLGYIARRGVDFGTSLLLQTAEGVARLAAQQPLELLSLLPDILPEVGLAAWNGLRLGCGPDAVKIRAVTITAQGGSEEAPDGTAAIDALWKSQPKEVGGLIDALQQNFLMLLFSGLSACEAVPGPRGTGVASVWPVNSLTLRFRRDPDGELNLYQRQTSDASGVGAYSSGMGGMFAPMPMERFFYAKIDGFPDDPYGRAPFAPALSEVLRLISFLQSVDQAFHRVGMPRYDIGIDTRGLAETAKDVAGLTSPEEIREYVQSAFGDTVDFFNSLSTDDAFFHDVNDKVNVLGSGKDMPDLKAIFDLYRWRLIIALKQNPVLMGFVDGSTETWSDVQWEIYGKGTSALVSKAAAPLVDAASLHLRLLGMPYHAVAEFEPIRSVQRKEDAEAESQEIDNEIKKVQQGWMLNRTAASAITGSDCPTPKEIAGDAPTRLPPVAPVPVTPTETITEAE